MATSLSITHHHDIDGTFYDETTLNHIVSYALMIMSNKLEQGLKYSYFQDAHTYWHKDKILDIYITNLDEGRQLNLNARGKNYATNILSYPSELPNNMLNVLDDVPLGELVICHEVVMREANEQGKKFEHHLHHLLVHGILHLLGFDHEISDADADEMENFEIEILQGLGINNPYS